MKRLTPFVVLVSILCVSAVAEEPAPARAPVDMQTPVTMTKQTFVDLLCLFASSRAVRWWYDPASSTLNVEYQDAAMLAESRASRMIRPNDPSLKNLEADHARSRYYSRRKHERTAIRVLSLIQRCIDPNAKMVLLDFD